MRNPPQQNKDIRSDLPKIDTGVVRMNSPQNAENIDVVSTTMISRNQKLAIKTYGNYKNKSPLKMLSDQHRDPSIPKLVPIASSSQLPVQASLAGDQSSG